ncbi:M48 family metallopeptidase [uncultured Desulfovibrio sp.]|uniref:M48 family metallopeptidase n=1 Tax=uncultured Desulfovibrio sp. TaxID=167968 RepID=UPI00280563FE|nr:M48 family metallopeptidase [uncultured Desulfovibrio sp.]
MTGNYLPLYRRPGLWQHAAMSSPASAPVETVSFALSGGETLVAAVRRSPRCRRPRLSVSPRGALVLVIPRDWPPARARQAAPLFLPWLERAWPRLAAARPAPSLPEHIALPLAGRVLAVEAAGDLAAGRRQSREAAAVIRMGAGGRRLVLLEGRETLRLFGAIGDLSLCAGALGRWCRAEAARLLPPHVRELALAHGFLPPQVSVRDQRSRWGSCSRPAAAVALGQPGRVHLNWRALLLERPLLDHLCRHELCHLRRMDHSAAYRAELARLSPDWAALERGLSRAWRELPWWALPPDGTGA